MNVLGEYLNVVLNLLRKCYTAMPSDTKYRQVPVDVFLKDFVLCRESLSSSPKPKEELVPSKCIDNAGGDMVSLAACFDGRIAVSLIIRAV